MKMGKVQTNNFLEKYFQIVQKIIDKLAPKEIIYKPGTSTSHHLKSNSKSDNHMACIIKANFYNFKIYIFQYSKVWGLIF
jgi:hypothetical protein